MKRGRSGPLRVLLVWVLLELVAAAQVPSAGGVLLVDGLRALLHPVAAVSVALVTTLGDLVTGLGDTRALIADHRRQRLELERAEAQRAALAAEVRVLRSAVPLVPSAARFAQNAVVVSCRSRDPLRGLMEISGGLRDGLRPDQPVVAAEGVVGRVWRVEGARSWVELITGQVAAVAVATRDGSVEGLARGTGGGTLQVLYVPRSAQLLVGTELLTSGADGIYPPSIPVARVSRVREAGGPFLEVDAVPVVRPARLRTVLVLAPGRMGDAP